MDNIIEVSDLSKKYRLGQEQRYYTLRDSIASLSSLPKQLWGVWGNFSEILEKNEFWALKDVSFSVKRGEVVGVIGKNGAGKSTLLKILSRITPPTYGQARLRGRVASLLEVGSGFNQELTGRENIFLNGAILGMSRQEVRRKFDEIVAFAEVERFIDTPVKRYSSGMYLRLAFAVAAHLEPEILLVDEVLSVGDAQFQEKSLGKMREITQQEGRTIIFVSHNMGAINALCNRCLLLEQGQTVAFGETAEVVTKYLSSKRKSVNNIWKIPKKPSVPFYVSKMWLTDENGKAISQIEMGENVNLNLEAKITQEIRDGVLAALVATEGSPLLYIYDTDNSPELRRKRRVGKYFEQVLLPTSIFKEGDYTISIMIGHGQDNLTDQNCEISFKIVNTKRDLTHLSFRKNRLGFLYQETHWEVRQLGRQKEY